MAITEEDNYNIKRLERVAKRNRTLGNLLLQFVNLLSYFLYLKNINKYVKILLDDLLYKYLGGKIMDNKNQERLEKLRQQQLIDSILGRNKIEHEALVEATKKSMDNSEIDINEEKNRIKNKNLKEIETKNNKEINDLQHKVLEEEVEIELQRMQEEERKQAEERKKETEKILKGIDETRKNRERMERRERERLRKRKEEKEKKKNNFLEQMKKLDITELKNRIESNNNNNLKNENSSLTYKPTYNTVLPNIKKYEQTKTTDITITESIKNKDERAKKINFKMYTVIQKYVSTMEFYERNKQIIQKARQRTNTNVNKTPSKRKSFVEHLISAVDHKRALENVEKKRDENPNIRPRIID